MIQKARAEGAANITLDSSLNAHEFYKNFGFKNTGPLKTTDIGGSKVRGYPMSLTL